MYFGLKVIQRLLLSLLLAIAMLPVYVMTVGSLKGNSALFQIPPDILPFAFTLENFKSLYGMKVFQWFSNSVIVSGLSTILTLFVACCAGYSFAKKNYPGKNIIFVILLATMMIPRQILMVPTFVLMRKIGLYDSLFGLILPAAAAPFGVFLMKQFMQTLPNELIESSIIDGCSEIKIFCNIVIPLSKPAIGALAIFVFMASWNDFMWQLILLTSRARWTMPLALANLMQEKISFVGYQMAGAAMASLPMIAIFLGFQSYFIKGITVGAIKG
ncbi:MAG: carbohydrate ABC transporter permease [Ruminiclostridium sp.]|nr:carbohydrate ABC transporter permease [Ruminiclostridium sp.]